VPARSSQKSRYWTRNVLWVTDLDISINTKSFIYL